MQLKSGVHDKARHRKQFIRLICAELGALPYLRFLFDARVVILVRELSRNRKIKNGLHSYLWDMRLTR